MEHVGWKRAWVLADDGQLLIAGAFAKMPVPIDVNAPDGTPGFSAYRARVDAHRYQPARLPLVTVAITGLRDGVHPDTLVGHRQRVLAVELNALCVTFACVAPVERWRWSPWAHRSGLDELVGYCTTHDRPTDREARIDQLGVPARVLGTDLSRLVRSGERTRQPGCACTTVSAVGADRGLHWYIAELWDWTTARRAGAVVNTRCGVCGSEWEYHRDQQYATRVDEPR